MSPVSALAAFNNSGTQATAATTSISGDDVMSAFWGVNDTHRFLLFGSSINEIPTTGGAGAQFGGNHIFTVNNDLDALGDIYFTVQMTMPTTTVGINRPETSIGGEEYYDAKVDIKQFQQFGVTGQTAGVLGQWKDFGLAKFVRRVEFMVGTQVWQTMEANDVLNCLNAESYESAYTNIGFSTNGGNTNLGTMEYERDVGPVYSGARYQASFKLPLLSKTLGPNLNKFVSHTEDGYLMAAAPHQTVKIRISYAQDSSDMIQPATTIMDEVKVHANAPGSLQQAAGEALPLVCPIVSGISTTSITSGISQISTALFAKHQVMCNAERQQLRNMAQGLPKRIKMTQNATATVNVGGKQQPFTVDLDHFSLFASALVVNVQGLEEQVYETYVEGVADQAYEPQDCAIFESPTTLLETGVSGTVLRPTKVMGGLTSAELILNSSSVSGVLPGFFLTSSAADSLGLFSNYYFAGSRTRAPGSGYSVFPLASHAYDASAVPLNRFDNIRLRLICSQASPTGTPAKITVTCLGETTALYKGGAASLAMY